jgi:hypothetical protein
MDPKDMYVVCGNEFFIVDGSDNTIYMLTIYM